MFIHSSADGNVENCFLLLATVNSPALNSVDKFLFEHLFVIVSRLYLGVELLACVVTSCLNFGGAAKLFSAPAVPFYNPISDIRGFQYLRILTNTCYFLVSGFCFK